VEGGWLLIIELRGGLDAPVEAGELLEGGWLVIIELRGGLDAPVGAGGLLMMGTAAVGDSVPSKTITNSRSILPLRVNVFILICQLWIFEVYFIKF
jgi:hypothetical protein